MNLPKKLYKISVEVAICDINENIDTSVVQDIKDVIAARSHLTLENISHNLDLHQVILNVLIDSKSEDMARRQIAEDFFEILSAILYHIDGVSIKILGSTLIQ